MGHQLWLSLRNYYVMCSNKSIAPVPGRYYVMTMNIADLQSDWRMECSTEAQGFCPCAFCPVSVTQTMGHLRISKINVCMQITLLRKLDP